MTTHPQEAPMPIIRRGDRPDVPAPMAPASTRPRWLVPAVASVIGLAVLVVYGVLPASAALYAGLFGGMLLMHSGGHGAHGGHSAAHHAGMGADLADPSRPIGGSEPDRTGSGGGLDGAPSNDPDRIASHDHDGRGSHGCH